MTGPALVGAPQMPVRGGELDAILEHLRRGGLLVYPTETVYGLGGIPRRRTVARIAALKDREPSKPMLILIPRRESVADLVWTEAATQLASVFWPGPMTLILTDPESRFPAGVRGPSGGVAVRVSPHPLVKAMVEGLDEPIVSTSANEAGGVPAIDVRGAMRTAEALGVGGDLWVLDGGDLPPSLPSTIIDCTGGVPTVLREGSVPLARLRRVLPDLEARPE